jgi:hypothetical protein
MVSILFLFKVLGFLSAKLMPQRGSFQALVYFDTSLHAEIACTSMDQFVFDLENEATTKLIVRVYNISSGVGGLKRRRDFEYPAPITTNYPSESYPVVTYPAVHKSPYSVYSPDQSSYDKTTYRTVQTYQNLGILSTLPIPQESKPCDTLLIAHMSSDAPDDFILDLLKGYPGLFFWKGV